MKRLFLATVLILVISAFVVAPAFASDGCEHDMSAHDPTVASLIMHVDHAAEAGHIKSVLLPALLGPLHAAANEDLPLTARMAALQAFIDLVNAQSGKGIPTECASHLVMHAQQVIGSLTPPA